jgi:hypothetical protein
MQRTSSNCTWCRTVSTQGEAAVVFIITNKQTHRCGWREGWFDSRRDVKKRAWGVTWFDQGFTKGDDI